jgi:hypothetical protein
MSMFGLSVELGARLGSVGTDQKGHLRKSYHVTVESRLLMAQPLLAPEAPLRCSDVWPNRWPIQWPIAFLRAVWSVLHRVKCPSRSPQREVVPVTATKCVIVRPEPTT